MAFASCKTIKLPGNMGEVKMLSEKKLIDSIIANELRADWIKSRGSSTINFDNESQGLDFNLRIRKDSLTWLNISKFKKKIARALFQEDSVMMALEYPEKLFFNNSYRYLKNETGVGFSYSLIENLFCGGSFINNLKNKFKLTIEENQYHIYSKVQNEETIIFQSWVNPLTFKSNRINISLPNSIAEIDLFYSSWTTVQGITFPLKINMVLNINSIEYSIEIEHKSLKFNTPLKFPGIKVNQSYKSLIINDK